jgi:hypothetical protein
MEAFGVCETFLAVALAATLALAGIFLGTATFLTVGFFLNEGPFFAGLGVALVNFAAPGAFFPLPEDFTPPPFLGAFEDKVDAVRFFGGAGFFFFSAIISLLPS